MALRIWKDFQTCLWPTVFSFKHKKRSYEQVFSLDDCNIVHDSWINLLELMYEEQHEY